MLIASQAKPGVWNPLNLSMCTHSTFRMPIKVWAFPNGTISPVPIPSGESPWQEKVEKLDLWALARVPQ